MATDPWAWRDDLGGRAARGEAVVRDPWPLPASHRDWPEAFGKYMSRNEQIVRLDNLGAFVGPVCGPCAEQIARTPELFPEVDHSSCEQVGSQRRLAQRCRAGHV